MFSVEIENSDCEVGRLNSENVNLWQFPYPPLLKWLLCVCVCVWKPAIDLYNRSNFIRFQNARSLRVITKLSAMELMCGKIIRKFNLSADTIAFVRCVTNRIVFHYARWLARHRLVLRLSGSFLNLTNTEAAVQKQLQQHTHTPKPSLKYWTWSNQTFAIRIVCNRKRKANDYQYLSLIFIRYLYACIS